MPTCFVCFKEISEQEFTGAEAHKCQETSLGEPGDAIPTSDLHSNLEYKDDSDYPSSSGSPSSIARHPPRDVRRSLNLAQRSARLRQPGFEELVPGTFSSPITSLPPLDIIHRATDRRIKALESDLEQLGASSLRNLVPINPLQDLERNYRRHRRHRSAPHSRQRPLPSLPERESKQAEEESKQKAESGYGSEETLPSSSFRRHPSPPLTPWRRLLLIQDYTDHKDDLKTIINRLDDAIAATPELWISEFSEGTDGRSVPTLQFYRELHEFHQQRIANGTPSSIPYFFSRLGAKRQMQELGEILKNNRDKVNGITKAAEEVMNRAATNGNEEGFREINGDAGASQIRKLEIQLLKANRAIEILKSEQANNAELIGKYEDALGTSTEQIRNYCTDNNMNYLAQRQHYNNLLQAEKDEHLQSRLDRDYWHAQTLKVCEMLRTAYRLRTDEWGEELKVISGLQNEVRVLRKALGLEVEKPEEETGWPCLRDAPLNLDNIDET